MTKYLLFFVLLLFIFGEPGFSQQSPNITSSFGFESFITTGDQAPLWMFARQQGRWNPIEKSQVLSYGYVGLKKSGKKWSFGTEVELDYSSGNKQVYLHTANLGTSWKFIQLKVGRHRFAPIFESNYLGSGPYLFGDNSRPVDRITIGIPEFTKLFFPLGRIEVRGEISHGRLDDGNGFYNHKSLLLHEKYAYIRWDGGNWLPYVGLSHSVFMGGYNVIGRKVPIDYWKSFFARSSEKIGGGDATNAAGAHMGLYDFGFYRKCPKKEVRVYYQIPFSDKSGMLFWKRNVDQIAGFNFTIKKRGWIENFTIEWISTSHQTGNSLPDVMAFYPDGTSEILPSTILLQRDLDELMAKLGQTQEHPYTIEEVTKYLQDEFNKGRLTGGRDGYLNNGEYPAGWTYHGLIMGSPLNLTIDQLKLNNLELGEYKNNFIVNDRVKAIHFGGRGSLTEKVKWSGMFTYSVNYGSYYNQYPGRYTWYETPDYYFKGGLKQVYTMLGAKWSPDRLPDFEFSGNLSLDIGEIFTSFGIKLGTKWYL